MALKKSQLYSSLWDSCDELRGGMDASQYKDYVLVLLFVKYVSDKYAGQKDALIDVPKGGGFADMVALKGDKEIGDKINKIITKLAEANDLKGVIDVADFNEPDKLGKGKEMVDRLSKLVGIFEGLNFSRNRADGDDLLGDAYEYLMRHFATESGKSKGQFYTPAEVSRIMAKVIGLGSAKSGNQTIHDPTCGSGSLLLKAHDEAKGATGHDLALYGQENDNATKALAQMNMILHDCPTAEIWKDNTLSSPHFTKPNGSLKAFDFVVANPPFSTKAWSNGFDPEHDLYGRFEFGIPPKKNGDYAFLLHVLTCLKTTGKGAIILPHGVLFRGNAEGDIRREIVRRGYIKGIIGLPANLFYGTGIPACILVLDKENASARKGIFMIDASRGFIKDGNKNRLRAQDIHKIVDAFTRQAEIDRFSRMVPLAEVSDPKNDYNLNIPRYVDSSEPEDIQDIDAHLNGGIPDRDIDALGRYWKILPSVRAILFGPDRAGYSNLKPAAGDVKTAIFGHTEFTAFNATVTKLFEKWKKAHVAALKGIAVGDKPKALIEILSEALLDTFEKAPLLDPYDTYQHLMDYWAETMQDDVYQIVVEGWKGAMDGVPNRDLIPEPLVVHRYFPGEKAAIEGLEAARDAISRQMVEMDEEHGGEEGLLADAKTEKGKLTKGSVKARLAEVEEIADADDERKALQEYMALIEKESSANKKVKDAQNELDEKVRVKYGKLTADEVKTLVVDDKWLASLAVAVQSELDRVSQALTGRVRQLAERYATPLPKLTDDLACLSSRTAEHLKQATMQQLLTGEVRLPGFSEEWQTHTFGEMFDFLRSASNSRSDLTGHGAIGYLHYGDIHTHPSAFLDCSSELRTFLAPGKAVNAPDMADGDLVMVDASEDTVAIGKAVEIKGLNGRRAIAGLHTFLLRARPGFFADGFKGYLQYFPAVRAALVRLATGVSVYGVSKTNVKTIEISIPKPNEQAAMAAVLSDMDAEIAATEARRNKLGLVKQGMIQALLTRGSLVVPVAATAESQAKSAVTLSVASAPAHNWAINEAVVISVLAKTFGSEKFPLGRKRYTKLSYLLHRHVERKAEGYLKKAAGPYNPSTKYKGPEAIAQKNKYIRKHNNGTYTAFVAAENIAQAEGYFEKWYGPDVLKWLDQFHYEKTEKLEVLATVDMAVQDLRAAGTAVTLDAVKGVIRSHPEWEAKLDRPVFADASIAAAMEQSESLFA